MSAIPLLQGRAVDPVSAWPQSAAPNPDDANANGKAYVELHRRLLAGGYVEYRPALATLVGGPKPALMLGHALYWTRTWLRQQPQRDGWFWKTAREWTEATGLSPSEQESAREALCDSGVMSETLRGCPARMFYRVNLDVLCERLGVSGDEADDEQIRFDRLAALLERPVMFFRPMADIAGSVVGGLVLSHLLDRYRGALVRKEVDDRGFFAADVEEARIALSLGPKAQRNAREALRKMGLMQEAWTAEKRSRLMVRLNMQALLACLCGQERPQPLQRSDRRAASPPSSGAEAVPVRQSLPPDRARVIGQQGNVTRVTRLLIEANAKPAATRRLLVDAVDRHCRLTREIRHSSLALLSKQRALAAAKGCPFVETRVALLPKLYTKPNISKTTTTARTQSRHEAEAPCQAPGSSRSLELSFQDIVAAPLEAKAASAAALVLPERLDPSLHAAAVEVVEKAPEGRRQSLLDELAGRLAAPINPLDNPVGWLAKLVVKVQRGEAILTRAPLVSATRAAKQKYERAAADFVQAMPSVSHPLPSAAPTDPSPCAKKTIEELRKRLGLKTAKGKQ